MEPITLGTIIAAITGAFTRDKIIESSVAGVMGNEAHRFYLKALDALKKNPMSADGGLPLNHDIENASMESLRAAARVLVMEVANTLDPQKPLLALLRDYFREGKFGKVPLLEAGRDPQRRWLWCLQEVIDGEAFGQFHAQRMRIDPDLFEPCFKKNGANVCQTLHGQLAAKFLEWARMQIWAEGTKEPAAFETAVMRTVKTSAGDVSLGQIYCLFFREHLKHKPEVFRIFSVLKLEDIKTKVDELCGRFVNVFDEQLSAIRNLEKLFTDAMAMTWDKLDGVDEHISHVHAALVSLIIQAQADHQEVMGLLSGVATDVRDVKKTVTAIHEHLVAAPRPVASVGLHPLIGPVHDFTGRVAKLNELRGKITGGGVAITGLRGMGGAGKTQLARKLADELKADYPGKQIEIDLKGAGSSPLSPAEVLESILRAFTQEKLPEKLDDLAGLVRGVLQTRRVLLLLDNAKDAAQIRTVMPPPEGCLVIVTSRNHFQLDGMESVDLGKMEPEEARQMLQKIAGRKGKAGALELTDDLADRIAHELDYLALALRIAGSYLRNFHYEKPVDYLNGLEMARRGDGRQEGAPPSVIDSLDEHAALAEVECGLRVSFAASYDRLKPELQRRFTQMFIFPDHFDKAALFSVWDVEPDEGMKSLHELQKFSLVEWLEKEQRHDIHDLLAEFAASLLGDERDEVVLRYTKYFMCVAAAADDLYLKGGECVKKGLALFDRERQHIEHTLEYLKVALSENESMQILRCRSATMLSALMNSLSRIAPLRFHPRKYGAWLDVQRMATQIIYDLRSLAHAFGNRGNIDASTGRLDDALKQFNQAYTIYQNLDDLRGSGICLMNIGNILAMSGHARGAIKYYERAMEVARQCGDIAILAGIIGNLGSAYAEIGDMEGARKSHKEHLSLSQKAGDPLGECTASCNLGIVCAVGREYAEAIELFEKSREIALGIGYQRGVGNALWNWALALEELGKRSAAIRRAEAALEIYEAIEDSNAIDVRDQLAKWRGV